MSMRVTNNMLLQATMRDLTGSQRALQKAQTTLSTGREVNKASDDPARATLAMSLRHEIRRSDHRDRQLSDAQGWLGTADYALTGGLDIMTRVKGLAVRGAATGVIDADARDAIAKELTELRDELIAISNTEYAGRPVFSGTTGGAAYDASGTYIGNDGAVRRDVAPGSTVSVNLTGPKVFGDQVSPQGNLFDVIERLAAAIQTGDDAAIQTGLANLDAAQTTMTSALGEIGARSARLELVATRTESEQLWLTTNLSTAEDADLAEALMNVNVRESAYTAALTAASKSLIPSLVNFLS
jgi:flagellar hook-associated protein 3 FlgL